MIHVVLWNPHIAEYVLHSPANSLHRFFKVTVEMP